MPFKFTFLFYKAVKTDKLKTKPWENHWGRKIVLYNKNDWDFRSRLFKLRTFILTFFQIKLNSRIIQIGKTFIQKENLGFKLNWLISQKFVKANPSEQNFFN